MSGRALLSRAAIGRTPPNPDGSTVTAIDAEPTTSFRITPAEPEVLRRLESEGHRSPPVGISWEMEVTSSPLGCHY